MKIIKIIIFIQQFWNVAISDLIGINRYQNTIQNHNTGLNDILVEYSKTALERALLKQYISFLTASKSVQTQQSNSSNIRHVMTAFKAKNENADEKFAKLRTAVKRTFRRHRYFKNMQQNVK